MPEQVVPGMGLHIRHSLENYGIGNATTRAGGKGDRTTVDFHHLQTHQAYLQTSPVDSGNVDAITTGHHTSIRKK